MFIGIDTSTTGTTVLALAEDGSVVVGKHAPHALSTPHSGWSEQHPSHWWQAICTALHSLWKTIDPKSVRGIGLTGQMLGLVTLDAKGDPIRPAILWNDQRSAAECETIEAAVGAKRLYNTIGSKILPGMTLPKLLWMRNNEKDEFARIDRILLPKDYVSYCLSGTFQTDVTDASGTGLFDIGKRCWSNVMVDGFGIPYSWLPMAAESQDIIGTVSQSAGESTGLIAGTPIIAGAGDQAAQAIGSGIVRGGDVSLTIGTSGVVFVASDRYAPDVDGRWHTFCHAIPIGWCHMGVMLSAAGSLQWLRDRMFPELSFAEMDRLAESVPAGCNGVLFAPYLCGERHPYPDPNVRGAFIGLSLAHGRGEAIRAVMEGVAFGLRDLIELAREAGCHPTTARVSGGAAKSRLWLQILADATGLNLIPTVVTHGGAMGAAILAGVGVGAWPSIAEATSTLIKTEDSILPGSDAAATAAAYAKYRKLYPALSSLTD